jgi:TonB family protein
MTTMLLLLLAMASESLAPAPPPLVGGQSVVSIFSVDDYPKEAMAHGWQGTVVAELTVSSAGRVSKCRIVRSSGHQVIDDKTCEILSARARFIPAKDIDGRPTVDTLRTPPIVWRLESAPPDAPPLNGLPEGWEGAAEALLTVSAQGGVSACRIVKSSGNTVVDNATCGILVQRAHFKPARDPNGFPIEDTVSRTIRWRLQDQSLRMTDPLNVRE